MEISAHKLDFAKDKKCQKKPKTFFDRDGFSHTVSDINPHSTPYTSECMLCIFV